MSPDPPRDADAAPAPGRSVTSRVLAVLDAFDAVHPRLTLTRIADRTGLPTSTVHRLVTELEAGGALERDERGGFRIGRLLRKVASLAVAPPTGTSPPRRPTRPPSPAKPEAHASSPAPHPVP